MKMIVVIRQRLSTHVGCESFENVKDQIVYFQRFYLRIRKITVRKTS